MSEETALYQRDPWSEDEMRVRDVMNTTVVVIGEKASLREAAALMLSNSVSGLPVIDGQGKIVGVISESDIIRRREGLLAHWLEVETFLGRNQAESDDDIEDPEYLNCVVEDAMTRNPVSVGPDTPVREAARLMVAHKINRLPVVDKAQIVGIVTRGDIMRAFTTRTS